MACFPSGRRPRWGVGLLERGVGGLLLGVFPGSVTRELRGELRPLGGCPHVCPPPTAASTRTCTHTHACTYVHAPTLSLFPHTHTHTHTHATHAQALCSSLPHLERLQLEIPSDCHPHATSLLMCHPSLASLELSLNQGELWDQAC